MLVFGTGRYSACYQDRNIYSNPTTNALIYNTVLPANYARAVVAQACEGNQPMSDLMYGPLYEIEPIPDTAWKFLVAFILLTERGHQQREEGLVVDSAYKQIKFRLLQRVEKERA